VESLFQHFPGDFLWYHLNGLCMLVRITCIHFLYKAQDMFHTLDLLFPLKCQIGLCLINLLIQLHQTSSRQILRLHTEAVQHRAVFPTVIAVQSDTAAKISQIFVTDSGCLGICDHKGDTKCKSLSAQRQKEIVFLSDTAPS